MLLWNSCNPWVLSIDRTEWSFGQTRFNIFMLGVVHQGVAYPLVWTMLPKKGNSNSDERMDLVDKFREIFPDAEIAYLCGDREFIGKEWLGVFAGIKYRNLNYPLRLRCHSLRHDVKVPVFYFLASSLTYLMLEPMIPFRLRIKANQKIHDGHKSLSASIIFAHLQPGQSEVLSGRRWVWGRFVYVCALRLEQRELLIILSDDSPTTAITDYAQRWGIETLFGMFKSRGFCLESTHFTDSERLSKLLALMSFALCWAIKTGDWLSSHRPLKVKKHGRQQASIFRYGFDYLRSIVTDLDLKSDDFLHSLQFLSCT